jgi:hypothetical protein
LRNSNQSLACDRARFLVATHSAPRLSFFFPGPCLLCSFSIEVLILGRQASCCIPPGVGNLSEFAELILPAAVPGWEITPRSKWTSVEVAKFKRLLVCFTVTAWENLFACTQPALVLTLLSDCWSIANSLALQGCLSSGE